MLGSLFKALLWPVTVPFKLFLWPVQVLNTLTRLCLAVTCIATATGFFGQWHWLLDLTSHFRLQYALILLILSVVFTVTLNKKKALTAAIFLVFNLIPLWPFLPHSTHPLDNPAASIRILHANLWYLNWDSSSITKLIQREKPDILSLAEYDSGWKQKLDNTQALIEYPYHISNRDIGLFSRTPLHDLKMLRTPASDRETMTGTLIVKNRPVQIFATHTWTPLSPKRFLSQREHFRFIGIQVQKYKTPSILVGDLNTTPWSSNYQLLQETSGLIDTQQSSGLQPSWPTWLVIPWLALDNVFVSPQLHVSKRYLGPYIASDHFPVIAEIQIPGSQ